MIFSRICVICDDFGDYHDEIVVTSIDSSAGGQFVAIICKGRGSSRAPYKDNDSGSSISSLVVAERKPSFEGDKSASYVIPDDATADILSAI